MDLRHRIFHLLKSLSQDQADRFDQALRGKQQGLEEELKSWEKGPAAFDTPPRPTPSGPRVQPSSPYPKALVEDLAVFGLTPPATLEAVKKIRNQEIKKYHPDRFAQDPEKQAIAKEILQLINAAYARLEKHPLMK